MGKWAFMVALVLASIAGCNSVKADADVHRRVVARLGQEATPAEQLTVSTRSRVVRLTGVVQSDVERARLERAVREVDGVAGVDDRLLVEAPVTLTSGEMLAQDPVDALLHDAIRSRLDADALGDIAVEVKDRIVTLTGRVPRDVHDSALRIAIDATPAGEGRVVDHLTIAAP